MLEGRMNGGSSNAKSIADLLVRQAFSLKGLGGLEIPAQRKVLNGVLSLGDDFKVLRSVVDLVPVDVVNIPTGKNLALRCRRRGRCSSSSFPPTVTALYPPLLI